ncbi:MAG: ABC transporter [Legionellales bacterium]|nr:ABC transporter [Legionellales bacterium]|tara:strand:+ start:733 stop:1665 length:933 start_codon:yes stop_codon:yes gene_type:complete
MIDKTALSIVNCSKTYENNFTALREVNLHVTEGSFLALLGPNGAGKSTIINCITNLIDGYSGTIEVFGHNLVTEQATAKQLLGCVPQEINLNRFETTYNTLMYNAGYHGIDKSAAHDLAIEILDKLKLTHKKDSPTGMLSGGMKRRCMIARALMHKPPLLILDEPSAGVDVETRQSTWQLLRSLNEEGMTIILTTHYLEEAEALCDDIAILNEGQVIYENKMATLLHTHQQNALICSTAQSLPSDFTLSSRHKKIGHNRFEVTLKSTDDLPSIMQEIQQQSIVIKDMHSPSSKLESIYTELLHKERHPDE